MSTGHERRLQLRFALAAEESLTARLEGEQVARTAGAMVHDLSLSGAGVSLADPRVLYDTDALWLELCGPTQFFGRTRAEPVHLHAMSEGHELVGMRFEGTDEPFLHELSRYLVARDARRAEQTHFLAHPEGFQEVCDERRIRRLLMYCCRRQRPLRLFAAPGRSAGVAVPMAVGEECFTARIDQRAQSFLQRDSHCCLVLPSFTGLYLLPVNVLGWDDSRAMFSLPERILTGGVRRVGRLSAEDGFPVWLDFLHPQLPAKLVCKLAREMGLGGLGFSLDIDEDLLARGTVLESAVLRLPGGHTLPCRCIVRHISCSDGGYLCGVELLDFAGNGRQVWVQKVLSRMNPHVYEATTFRLGEVWEVFERSGYLEEKPADLMQSMRAPFLSAWRRLLNEREGSRCWVYRTEGHALGTVCASRVYSNAWIIHHLAVDRVLGAAQKLLIVSELFPQTAFQWLAGIAPDGNIVGYFDAKKAFNQGAWVKFLHTYQGPGKTDVQEVTLRDYTLDGSVPLVWPGDLWVRQANPGDAVWIAKDLEQRDGEYLCEALDYTADRLLFAEVGKPAGWDALGRTRSLYVAGQEERPLGYAMLESAAPGLNIFSLYDLCRVIVFVSKEDALYGRIRDLLFSEAARKHAQQGRTSLLYWSGPRDAPPPDWQPFVDIPAIRAVFQADAVSAWVEYLQELWVQR